jgi:hypothetical protein
VNRAWKWTAAALIAVAAMLRLMGVYDDFWLDEIWSWRIAANMARPWQILTDPGAHWDNNHPLNTLLMWFIGVHPYGRVYRAPALLAGIASVIVASLILRRRGRPEMLAGLLLVGFSYPLVFFSSEARGYALVIFFALLAFDAIDRYLTSRGVVSNAIFILACILGFASHLTFLYLYAGVFAWSISRLLREARPLRSGVLHLLRLHVVPLAWVGFLYVTFVRHLQIGGAPSERLVDALRDSLGRLLGAGDSPAAAVAMILLGGVLFVATLRSLYRRRMDLWIALAAAVVTPVVVVAFQVTFVEQRQPIASRYFLVPFVFFLLGLSILLGDWLRRRDAWRWAAIALLAGFLALNLYHTAWFLRIGRGQYLAAVARMSERTPLPVIVVSSDHAWRTGFVLNFYRFFLPPHQQMIIYDDSNLPRLAPRTHGPPMWVVIHSNLRGQPPAEAFDQYVFDREFTYYGFSGYSWYLYRHRQLPPAE